MQLRMQISLHVLQQYQVQLYTAASVGIKQQDTQGVESLELALIARQLWSGTSETFSHVSCEENYTLPENRIKAANPLLQV